MIRQPLARVLNADDLLTWEVQLRREGTLPPEAQAALLLYARERLDPRKISILPLSSERTS